MHTEIVGFGEMQFELGPCLIGGQEIVPFKHGGGICRREVDVRALVGETDASKRWKMPAMEGKRVRHPNRVVLSHIVGCAKGVVRAVAETC